MHNPHCPHGDHAGPRGRGSPGAQGAAHANTQSVLRGRPVPLVQPYPYPYPHTPTSTLTPTCAPTRAPTIIHLPVRLTPPVHEYVVKLHKAERRIHVTAMVA